MKSPILMNWSMYMVKCGQIFIWLDVYSLPWLAYLITQYSHVLRCDLDMHISFQSYDMIRRQIA
jgi:hypothetical protein